jgi:LysR family nitrogen assimilation transcriptional regulator
VTGSIALGLPPSIAATFGAPLATKSAERYPEAQLIIRECFSGVLIERVECGASTSPCSTMRGAAPACW